MSEGWQTCGDCGGNRGKDVEVGKVFEDLSGLNRPPQVRTIIEWRPCGTCVGTGQVQGGTR